MRFLDVVTFLVTLCCSLPVILTELYINDLGALHYRAEIGHEPLKYTPLSTLDQTASEKAAEVMDFIQLIPKIDPMVVPMLPPIGIDIPLLFLKGKVFIKNFEMSGLKKFQLLNMELRLINLRSDLNLNLPRVSIAGDFYMQAYLTLVPLYLKCHVSVDLYDLNVVATTGGKKVQSPTTGEMVLQVDSIRVTVNIRDVVVNVTDVVINGPEEETDPPVMQLFTDSRRKDDSTFAKILGVGLDIANRELLKIPFDVFEQYLTSDTLNNSNN